MTTLFALTDADGEPTPKYHLNIECRYLHRDGDTEIACIDTEQLPVPDDVCKECTGIARENRIIGIEEKYND